MELPAYTRIVLWEWGSLWVSDASPATAHPDLRTRSHARERVISRRLIRL